MSATPYTPFDPHRLGEAVGHPGIDPRTWTARAVVVEVINEPTGYLAKVQLPDGTQELAHVGQAYAGNGFGSHFPVEVDDLVTVAVWEGDPRAGLVVISRHNDAGDPPSTDAIAHPTDVLIVVKSGKTCRIIVAGGGDVILEARGGGVVKLGASTETLTLINGAVNGEALDTASGLTQFALGNASTKVLVEK